MRHKLEEQEGAFVISRLGKLGKSEIQKELEQEEQDMPPDDFLGMRDKEVKQLEVPMRDKVERSDDSNAKKVDMVSNQWGTRILKKCSKWEDQSRPAGAYMISKWGRPGESEVPKEVRSIKKMPQSKFPVQEKLEEQVRPPDNFVGMQKGSEVHMRNAKKFDKVSNQDPIFLTLYYF